MAQEINPELLARLEKHKLYKDVFVRQYKEKKRTQRAAAKVRAKEPAIAIGVNGQMNIVSPGELRNLRQKELQDVFGTQQSSLLSKKIKEDKILGSQKAVAQAKIHQAKIDAQAQASKSKTISQVPKEKTSLKAGKPKIKYKPVYTNEGRLTGFQKFVNGVGSDILPYNPNVVPKGMGAAYTNLFAAESVALPKGNSAFRVKAGRTVSMGGKTYKGGQFIPTHAGIVDNITGRILGGQRLHASELSYLEENMPPNFIERTLQNRLPTGGSADPNSLVNMTMADKKQWMMQDEQIVKEKQKAIFEADKQQKIAAYREQQAIKRQQQKVQAVLSSDYIDPAAKTSYAKLTPSAVDEVSKVTQKKALSLRTMERLMSSHTLAAGVAAGGLGIMYAFNRRRGEEQVGR